MVNLRITAPSSVGSTLICVAIYAHMIYYVRTSLLGVHNITHGIFMIPLRSYQIL